MADIHALAEELSSLTVLEAGQLAKMLEERWGVSASPAQVVGPAPGPVEEAPPEQTEFTVTLTGVGDKKLEVVKAIRANLSGLTLKDAMAFGSDLPKVLRENISRDEADKMKKTIEEAGGAVEIK